jgi:S-formylglutathione hydrolase FrmB
VWRSWLVVLALLLGGCGGGGAGGDTGDRGKRERAPSGFEVVRYSIGSAAVGRSLPQVGLRPPSGRRPLLVFLHGRADGGGGESSNLNDDFTRALAALGPRAPAVVFPSGGTASYWHDRSAGAWGRYVADEVIPAAVRRLRADPRRVAIGGISMGGFGAYDIARLHPGRFCAVGGHSAAVWPSSGETAPGAFDDAADFGRHDVITAARANPREYGRAALWLDGGDADPFHPGDEALAAALGIHMHVWPGAHSSTYWRSHYRAYLRFYAGALARC